MIAGDEVILNVDTITVNGNRVVSVQARLRELSLLESELEFQ